MAGLPHRVGWLGCSEGLEGAGRAQLELRDSIESCPERAITDKQVALSYARFVIVGIRIINGERGGRLE